MLFRSLFVQFWGNESRGNNSEPVSPIRRAGNVAAEPGDPVGTLCVRNVSRNTRALISSLAKRTGNEPRILARFPFSQNNPVAGGVLGFRLGGLYPFRKGAVGTLRQNPGRSCPSRSPFCESLNRGGFPGPGLFHRKAVSRNRVWGLRQFQGAVFRRSPARGVMFPCPQSEQTCTRVSIPSAWR